MCEDAPMKASWEDEYSISFYEVDTKNEVFLPVVWSFMQETAWHHADHLRVGYSDLMGQQYFWVLSRLSVRMEEYPCWGDRIKVKTWLTGTGRLFALRQFSIADLTGKILGTARSAWLVLDLKSRKPQKIEPVFKHLRHLFDPLSPAEEPEKLPTLVRPKSRKSYEVRYSDIDVHHHVNNIKYIEWILDSVPFEMNQTHQIHTFEINFLAEASCEDSVSIQTETLQESPPVFLHRVSREGEGKELCRARTGWKRVTPMSETEKRNIPSKAALENIPPDTMEQSSEGLKKSEGPVCIPSLPHMRITHQGYVSVKDRRILPLEV